MFAIPGSSNVASIDGRPISVQRCLLWPHRHTSESANPAITEIGETAQTLLETQSESFRNSEKLQMPHFSLFARGGRTWPAYVTRGCRYVDGKGV